MTQDEFSMLLCGVGGQGLVLLSNVIGKACTRAGIRAITGEQHGLSQRSGTVSIHMRIGTQIHSPLIPIGSSDALLALEGLEALRYIEYLRDDGVVIANSRIMHPISETDSLIKDKQKAKAYFSIEEVEKRLKLVSGNVLFLDALSLARKAGNPLTENMVLLGAVSVLKAFPLGSTIIRSEIERLVPAPARDANINAYELGAKASRERFCRTIECRTE